MSITSFILGIIWGFVIYHISLSIKSKVNNKKLINKISNKFSEVLSNLKTKKALFVSRVNNTVLIDMRIKELDIVNIVYIMDRNLVCIFKDNQCLYTTESVDESLQNEILSEINNKFNREINDVVDVMGTIISKEEFQNKIKELSILTSQSNLNIEDLIKESTETEIINEENDLKLDIDEILDKINKNGLESLSKFELEFLNNYSKNI
jgi:hypothetical protein